MLAKLCELSGTESIDPDSALEEVDVESIDVLEWLYALEEDHGISIDLQEFDDIEWSQLGQQSIRQIYTMIIDRLEGAVSEPVA